jgi:RimJ/RimL family protein N-acetyltransferase
MTVADVEYDECDNVSGMAVITERLLLRPWTAADLQELHDLWSDPKTICWGAHTTLDQTRALLQKIDLDGGWWAVEYQGRIVGNVFLRRSRQTQQALELGYHIRSSFWGMGFAIEAAMALLPTASGRRVEALVVPSNTRSKRVMQKLGFCRRPTGDICRI